MPIKPPPAVDDAGTKGHAAGILYVAPDGDVLLLRRSSTEENYSGHWALPSGKMDAGESPEAGADREAREEMGDAPRGTKKLLDLRRTPNDMVFHTFAQLSDEKFVPRLNAEHSGWAWAPPDMLPGPLHPGVQATFDERGVKAGPELVEWLAAPPIAADAELAFDRAPPGLDVARHGVVVKLAFDRDTTSQGKQVDGFERLKVARAPITKAGVNPYFGREIPKAKELGLDPDKVYRLLRHPDEIKKGAASSHNVPLLSKHVPHTADAHDGDITVGTVGSNPVYEHPYLYNSLAVWTRDGRELVDGGSQKELSSAYGYDADMTPGAYEGEPYDGVMRNMKWNHVCLVKKGRAGADVALDEALQPTNGRILMSTKLLSLKAGVAYGAVRNYLLPLLAQDSAIDLGPAFAKVKKGKLGAAKKTLVGSIQKALSGQGKLAQDADLGEIIENVAELIDAIDGDKTVADADISDRDPKQLDNPQNPDDDDTTMDAGVDLEAVRTYLKSKGVADDVIAGMPSGGAADEEDPEAKKKREEEERKKKEGAQDGKSAPVSKGAMDEAIALTRDQVRKETIAAMNGVADAKAKVKPVVGELSMAFDSAEGVYRQAFKILEKDVTGVKGEGALSALETMWSMVPLPNARPAALQIAQDSASTGDFAKQFPNMARVKRA